MLCFVRSKQILLSNKVQGENSVLYDMLANLCSSVKNLTCPLSSSPILAVNKGLDDCIEIGERVSDEIYLNNARQGLSGGFQLSLGRIRCCSNSNAREINTTLQILCNSNSPGLELGETDVLLELRNCTGLNNLTVTLLSPQLCSENIKPLDSFKLPGWAKAIIVVWVILSVLVFTVLACKSCKRCGKSSNGNGTETDGLLTSIQNSSGHEQTAPTQAAANDSASGDGASADGSSVIDYRRNFQDENDRQDTTASENICVITNSSS